MTDLRHRMRRTLPVVILDATIAIFTALQLGRVPWAGKIGTKRTAVIWMSAAGAAAVAGTVALLITFLHSPDGLAPLGVGSPPPTAVDQPAGVPAPSASTQPGVAGLGASPAPPAEVDAGGSPTAGHPTTLPPGSPVPLTARYAVAENGQGLLGYAATVAIANPGAIQARDWQLAVSLPRPTLMVTDIVGATARQEGSTWIFTPDARTAPLAPGGSAQVSFVVRGATLINATPTACTINGNPCTGLGTSS